MITKRIKKVEFSARNAYSRYNITFYLTLILILLFGDKGLADLNNLKQKKDNLIAENKRLVRENKALKPVIKRLRYQAAVYVQEKFCLYQKAYIREPK